jgi:hypothetical protein
VIIGIGRCESGYLTGKEPARQTNYRPRPAMAVPFVVVGGLFDSVRTVERCSWMQLIAGSRKR